MKRKKIVFVCTGNTCRSPMAEIILRDMIKKRKIKWWDTASCGLFAEVGGTISQGSRQALAEIGLSCDKFRPRQLTQSIIEKSFAVVCMTEKQKQIIEGCGNVYSIKDLCGTDVPDPYGCDIEVYRRTRDALTHACEIIIDKIILADGGSDKEAKKEN